MQISTVTSKLLLEEPPLLVLPALAKQIGLNEAIIMQQMHYWLKRTKHIHDDRPWIYNSVTSWQEQFPFWSTKTIQRTLKSLENKDLIVTGNFNKLRFDKTKWYSIKYDSLKLLCESEDMLVTERSIEKDIMSDADGPLVPLIDNDNMSKPIPETTKTTAETTTDIVVKKSDTPILPDWLNKEIWDEWKKHRKAIKKPLTDLAIKRQLSTLEKYKDQHEELLGEAIEKGWINIVTPEKRFNQGSSGSNSYGKNETAQERYRKDIASQGPFNTSDLIRRTHEVELQLHIDYGLSLAIISSGDRSDWLSYLGPDYVTLPIKAPMSRINKVNVLFKIEELRNNLYVHLHGREWSDKIEKYYQESNKGYIPLSELPKPTMQKIEEEDDEVPF